jgi:uncharacterized protein
MKFWDSSAIVPLCVVQSSTERSRRLLLTDSAVAVWWGTAVECASAFARLRRENVISEREERAAHAQMTGILAGSDVVQPSQRIQDGAMRALRLHPIRAADALQLAAALEWSSQAGESFVCFDSRLAEAAEREGFVVSA